MRWTTALLFALIADSVFAWGREGHQIVGKIAWNHLNPVAQSQVTALLASEAPQYQTLAGSTVWADDVKGSGPYAHTGPWHYVNLPVGATGGYIAERDCPEVGCIVLAIQNSCATLSSDEATTEDMTEALKFLTHFVGDIHQPLHAGYAEDRGGNTIRVNFFGRNINLHGLWDYGIIDHLEIEWEDYVELLEVRITPEQIEEWSDTDPIGWANESFALAVSNAYAIPPDGVITQDYFDTNIALIDQRLSTGGIRLAALLNAIWPEPEGPENVGMSLSLLDDTAAAAPARMTSVPAPFPG